MKSVQKIECSEKEIKLLIASLKNVLTDVPYDFMYDDENEADEQCDNG